jgi:hypothetical protein
MQRPHGSPIPISLFLLSTRQIQTSLVATLRVSRDGWTGCDNLLRTLALFEGARDHLKAASTFPSSLLADRMAPKKARQRAGIKVLPLIPGQTAIKSLAPQTGLPAPPRHRRSTKQRGFPGPLPPDLPPLIFVRNVSQGLNPSPRPNFATQQSSRRSLRPSTSSYLLP